MGWINIELGTRERGRSTTWTRVGRKQLSDPSLPLSLCHSRVSLEQRWRQLTEGTWGQFIPSESKRLMGKQATAYQTVCCQAGSLPHTRTEVCELEVHLPGKSHISQGYIMRPCVTHIQFKKKTNYVKNRRAALNNKH